MRLISFLWLFCSVALLTTAQEITFEKKVVKLMGCRFEITATAKDKPTALKAVEAGIAEITRIENLISEWIPATQTSEINHNAGIAPVKVDKELYDLVYRSTKISSLTQGAFDISFASMDRIWIFDGKEHPLPDSTVVREASQFINWQQIILNPKNSTVFLSEKGMKIGFGGIGKGYAANRAKAIMEKIPGVVGGLVNASGDIMAWGESHHPEGWMVQIANPKDKTKALGWIRLNHLSIVTSGDYEKFFTFNGTRYAHIINPASGYPITGIKSVTIICPDAELADALATSVAVLGVNEGLQLVNQLAGVECLIVDDKDELYTSDKIQLNYYQ